MIDNRTARLLTAVAMAAGLLAGGAALSASAGATGAPPGYPGSTEKLDWPKNGTIRPAPTQAPQTVSPIR
jgi:hypothetical protein